MSASTAPLPLTRVVVRQWHLFDGSEQTVGRVAQRVASLLMGKNRPTFNPNQDQGDNVTVVNCERLQFTGNRWDKKVYRYHTGFPGGLKEIPARVMMDKHPTHILRHAVAGMIPHNKFKHERLKRLKIFVGPAHSHGAQFHVDGLVLKAKFMQEADIKLSAAVHHDAVLPLLEPHLIGFTHLPTDPEIRESWLKQRESEEKAQATWLATADRVQEAQDTKGSRRACMLGAKRPFIPPSFRDTKLGFLPKQSEVLRMMEKGRLASLKAKASPSSNSTTKRR